VLFVVVFLPVILRRDKQFLVVAGVFKLALVAVFIALNVY
jgi:hypothetical protein